MPNLLPEVQARLNHDLQVEYIFAHAKKYEAEVRAMNAASMVFTLQCIVAVMFATDVAALLIAILTHHRS
jgi:hypothetical protein